MKAYTSKEKAVAAAGKRSLFAYLNKTGLTQYDAIEKDGRYFVVKAGSYPERPFTIIRQFHEGYSI